LSYRGIGYQSVRGGRLGKGVGSVTSQDRGPPTEKGKVFEEKEKDKRGGDKKEFQKKRAVI